MIGAANGSLCRTSTHVLSNRERGRAVGPASLPASQLSGWLLRRVKDKLAGKRARRHSAGLTSASVRNWRSYGGGEGALCHIPSAFQTHLGQPVPQGVSGKPQDTRGLAF